MPRKANSVALRVTNTRNADHSVFFLAARTGVDTVVGRHYTCFSGPVPARNHKLRVFSTHRSLYHAKASFWRRTQSRQRCGLWIMF